MRLIGSVALSALLLAACSTPQSSATVRPPAQNITLIPNDQGIGVAPGGQEIGFGRFQPGAVAAVSRVLGREPVITVSSTGCQGGALTKTAWPGDGLSMFFSGSSFVGWQAGEGRTFTGPLDQSGRVCS